MAVSLSLVYTIGISSPPEPSYGPVLLPKWVKQ